MKNNNLIIYQKNNWKLEDDLNTQLRPYLVSKFMILTLDIFLNTIPLSFICLLICFFFEWSTQLKRSDLVVVVKKGHKDCVCHHLKLFYLHMDPLIGNLIH